MYYFKCIKQNKSKPYLDFAKISLGRVSYRVWNINNESQEVRLDIQNH